MSRGSALICWQALSQGVATLQRKFERSELKCVDVHPVEGRCNPLSARTSDSTARPRIYSNRAAGIPLIEYRRVGRQAMLSDADASAPDTPSEIPDLTAQSLQFLKHAPTLLYEPPISSCQRLGLVRSPVERT
jgi:hypothetical protein